MKYILNKNEILKTIKQCYLNKKPLTDKQHQEAMYWFRQYMILGGMPQSVLYFIETNYKYELSDNIKLEILDLYRDDIQKNKYAYKHKVAALFDNVAGSLSKHDKRVVLSSIQANAKMRSFHDSIL